MAYTPVEMDDLVKVSADLQQNFASLSNRYPAPTIGELYLAIKGQKENKAKKIPKIESLEERYTKQVEAKATAPKSTGFFTAFVRSTQSDPTRIAQIKCIERTVEDVFLARPKSSIPETDVQKLEMKRWDRQAGQIVLGAVIYRLWRIGASYSRLSSPLHSALYRCLLNVLNIKAEAEIDQESFLSTCTAFRDYIARSEVKRRYSYLDDNPAFLSELDALIVKKSAEIGPAPGIRSQHFAFIHSSATQLARYKNEASGPLSSLAEQLQTKLTEMKSLDREGILSCLADTDCSDEIKSLIKICIPKSCVLPDETEIVDGDWISINNEAALDYFVTRWKLKVDAYCQFALHGAYVMSLKYKDTLPPAFGDTLNEAINNTISNVLDKSSQQAALKALKWFIDSVDFPVEAAAWKGMAGLKSEILRQWTEISQVGRTEADAELEIEVAGLSL